MSKNKLNNPEPDFRYFPLCDIVDKFQPGGRFIPVFMSASLKDEEEYIEKMIEIDRKVNLY